MKNVECENEKQQKHLLEINWKVRVKPRMACKYDLFIPDYTYFSIFRQFYT